MLIYNVFHYNFLHPQQIGILNRYPKKLNVTWNALAINPLTNETFHGSIPGHELLAFLDKNFTIKVFEKLHSSMKRINMSKRMFLWHKMDLFKDYLPPDPFPVDMFLRLPLGSPNQAYFMLGTKGTGISSIRVTIRFPPLITTPWGFNFCVIFVNGI